MIYYQSSPSWWIIKVLCENGGLEVHEIKNYVIKETGRKEKDIEKFIKTLIRIDYIKIITEAIGETRFLTDSSGLQIRPLGQLTYLTNQKAANEIIESAKQVIEKDKIVFSCRSEKTAILNWSGGIYYLDKINSSWMKSKLFIYLSASLSKESIEQLILDSAYALMPLAGKKYHFPGTVKQYGMWRYRLFVKEFERRCKHTQKGKKFFERMKKDIAKKTLTCIFEKELSLTKNNLNILIAHEHPVIRIMSKALALN